MRSFLLSLFLSTALLAAAGCGAHRSYTIHTDETGSLRALRTSPEDGDHDVPTDVWIRVYWLADYTPPSEFAFALRDGSDGRLYVEARWRRAI